MADKKTPTYPDPEWFADQLQELRIRTNAIIRLAKAHGIDAKTLAPLSIKRVTLKNAAYEVLRESRVPLHLTVVLDRLTETGVAPGGRRPASTLHATLGRDPRVHLVGPNVWAVAETDAAPAPMSQL